MSGNSVETVEPAMAASTAGAAALACAIDASSCCSSVAFGGDGGTGCRISVGGGFGGVRIGDGL